MDITFNNLTNTLNALGWEVQQKTDHYYVKVHTGGDDEHQYMWCEKMTNDLHQATGIPCLVYRKRLIKTGELQFEMYETICSYHEKLLRFSFKTKKYQHICRLFARWNVLDENGFALHEITEPADLQHVRAEVMTYIQELPEFRLYSITGML